MRTRSTIALLAAATVAVGMAFVGGRVGLIASGMKAKAICSGVFVSGRSSDAVGREDLAAYGSRFLDAVTARVDPEGRLVTASLLGFGEHRAVFRPGLGCSLVPNKIEPGALAAQTAGLDLTPRAAPPLPVEALSGDRGARLAQAVQGAFAEPDASKPRRTRAVVVLHDGRIVAEEYAPGVTPDTPLQGWSMAKSVIGTLVGILVREGKLHPAAAAPVPEWKAVGDPRGAITLDQLLRMSSGLAFAERYGDPFADVMEMLFAAPSAGGYAVGSTLEVRPGAKWQYSSGTSNVIARALATAFASPADYLAFPRRALFDRIGMTSAVLEPDAAGSFVGSSFMYATARDWARLGLLYAQDGLWDGKRVLPEGWVEYSRTPAPAAPAAQYGAHWWLKLEPSAANGRLPADAFHAAGHGGQFVTVVPSRKVVVVRLGLALDRGAWDQPAFVAQVLDALAAGD